MPTFEGDLLVTGSVVARDNVEAGNNMSAIHDIGAGHDVTAIHDVAAGNNMEAGNNVSANQDIGAGRDIVAQHNLVAGNNVVAYKNVQFYEQVQPLTPPVVPAGANQMIHSAFLVSAPQYEPGLTVLGTDGNRYTLVLVVKPEQPCDENTKGHKPRQTYLAFVRQP